MSDFKVTATRWDDGWELDIEGIGVTQCRTLNTAEHMVRDYLRLDGHKGADTADILFSVIIDGLEDKAAESKRMTAEAAEAQRAAAVASRKVARELREHGLSVADTAAVLGVSRGRVSQLVN